MGVDVYIKPESLANCPQAECKVYRPGFPFKGMSRSGRTMDDPGFRTLPVEYLPQAYRLKLSAVLSSHPTDPAHFAVRLNIIPDKEGNEPPQVLFESWVSQEEFLELRAAIKPGGRETWGLLNMEERHEICHYCPLKLNDDDCEPRLFGYGSLPALRRAARNVFTNPSIAKKPEVVELLESFNRLFPPNQWRKLRAGRKTIAAEERARWLASQMGKLILGADILKYPLDSTVTISEEIFEELIFREDEDGDMHFMSGEKLAELVSWVEAFLKILKKLKFWRPFDSDLDTLVSVMGTYLAAVRNAASHNLEFSVSS